MVFAGIDIGSLSTDTVIIDGDGSILGYDVSRTGSSSIVAAKKSFDLVLARLGLQAEDISRVVATGYGRVSTPFAHKTITEITCHARGAYALFPGTRTVIDIGGQDSKVIRVGTLGRVDDFAMNDKCAAGTGRFLEVMAKALDVELEDMGPLSMESSADIAVSSMCTVFAESEVISLVAVGQPVADIINGIHDAIANRICALVDRVGLMPQVTMTGGVAKNIGLVEKMKSKLGCQLNLPDEPQIVGALGAALMAREQAG
jgi:predicted CoA-substrate-specific enzyme activase